MESDYNQTGVEQTASKKRVRLWWLYLRNWSLQFITYTLVLAAIGALLAFLTYITLDAINLNQDYNPFITLGIYLLVVFGSVWVGLKLHTKYHFQYFISANLIGAISAVLLLVCVAMLSLHVIGGGDSYGEQSSLRNAQMNLRAAAEVHYNQNNFSYEGFCQTDNVQEVRTKADLLTAQSKAHNHLLKCVDSKESYAVEVSYFQPILEKFICISDGKELVRSQESVLDAKSSTCIESTETGNPKLNESTQHQKPWHSIGRNNSSGELTYWTGEIPENLKTDFEECDHENLTPEMKRWRVGETYGDFTYLGHQCNVHLTFYFSGTATISGYTDGLHEMSGTPGSFVLSDESKHKFPKGMISDHSDSELNTLRGDIEYATLYGAQYNTDKKRIYSTSTISAIRYHVLGGWRGSQAASFTDVVVDEVLATSSKQLERGGELQNKKLKVAWQDRIEQYPYKLISFTQDNYEFQVIDQPLASNYGGAVYVKYQDTYIDTGRGTLYLDVRIDDVATSSWFITDQDINGDDIPDLGLRDDLNKRFKFYEIDTSGKPFRLEGNQEFTWEYTPGEPAPESDVSIWPIALSDRDETIFGTSTFPRRLSYNEKAFYIGQTPAYTIDEDSFEIYLAEGNHANFHFLRLDDAIFGMGFMDLGTAVLIQLKNVNHALFEDIGNGYATDGQHLYYISVSEPLLELGDNSYDFLELEAVSEPVLIADETVFHRGRVLEGLDAGSLHVGNAEHRPRGYYLSDNDNTVYLQAVNCHTGSYYTESSLSEITGWRPGC